MFGLPTVRMYKEEYFETPEEAEEWVKAHPIYKILAAYKEPDERFKSYRYNRAVMQNTNMDQYNAVVIYQWRP